MTGLPSSSLPATLDARMLSFFRWWQSLIDEGNTVPYASRFKAEQVPDLAPDLILFERLATGAFHMRFSGDRVSDYLVGLTSFDDYLDRFNDTDSDFLGGHLSAISGRRCGGWMRRQVSILDGRLIDTSHLGLPLNSEDGVARYIATMVSVVELKCNGPHLSKVKQDIKALGYIDLGYGTPEAWPELKVKD